MVLGFICLFGPNASTMVLKNYFTYPEVKKKVSFSKAIIKFLIIDTIDSTNEIKQKLLIFFS